MPVAHSSMSTIETRNPENLFGLWTIFPKCSPAMVNGECYENTAWRLRARETSSCQPDHVVQPQWSFDQEVAAGATADVPELSTSIASDHSIDTLTASQHYSDPSASRPDLRRHDSATGNARGRHMAPIDLEKVIHSIQEKKVVEPMSPLPPHLAPQTPQATQEVNSEGSVAACSASSPSTARRCAPELSMSTFATARDSDDLSATRSEANTSTDMSQHSIVRGFEPGHISAFIRSSTNLAPTPMALKEIPNSVVNSPTFRAGPMMTKKQSMFTLNGPSDEDARSSLKAHSPSEGSSLSEKLYNAGSLKYTAHLNTDISLRQYQKAISDGEGAIQSDSDNLEESATEEEDSDDDWEDVDEEADEGDQPNTQTSSMFPRVDSKPNLTPRRSLLTFMIHEGDGAQATQNVGQRQQPPPILRSRTTLPNGSPTGDSSQNDSDLMMRQQASRAKPTVMTTSNVHPPALSPQTTRQFMLQKELSGSLRQSLLWERQQKNATTNAATRRPATTDLQNVSAMAQAQPMHTSAKSPNSYLDQGNDSYHTKGW
ncbi:hypothetical protein E8E12_002633 [Didymella heteroderae]|uniref:DUF3295 domain-containing protein n=1 Tax=Didymella heteroderae TaxID=1769908 RepID=A0A9P4WH23_9PLEO|nr:hypothetical protein E8E12_002633 [Didymella heteroderae]